MTNWQPIETAKEYIKYGGKILAWFGGNDVAVVFWGGDYWTHARNYHRVNPKMWMEFPPPQGPDEGRVMKYTRIGGPVVAMRWVLDNGYAVPLHEHSSFNGPYAAKSVRRLQMGRTTTEFDANGVAIRQYTHWDDVPEV